MTGKPIQFVLVDEAGRCHLQDEAARVLNGIQGQLAVVGIAGLARTGKSFLLNRLLGVQAGFDIGPTVNPCTKGLWIWDQPVQLRPDLSCILLDTEGLGSTQRTASCDMQIFSLCVLLSSYFVYNSMGAIDEQAIEDLNLVLHLAEHVHVRSGARSHPKEQRSDLARHFPSLLWVVRDFFLRLVDDRGNAITEREYLEHSLRSMPGQEDKNKVRGAIKELFVDRDCIALPRPVADEGDLRTIQHLPYESLRPRFREKTEAFVQRVYRSTKPKLVAGGAVTGAMLATLASEYCGAINAGAVPSIQSAWASATQMLLRSRRRTAVELFRRRLAESAGPACLPMDEEELRAVHQAASTAALALLQEPGLDATDPQVAQCQAELEHSFGRMLEQLREENLGASRRACEALASELFEWRIAPRLQGRAAAYGSIQELMTDWTQLREQYARRARGPAVGEISQSWIFQRMSESIQHLWGDLQSTSTQHVGSMARRLEEAEARSEGVSHALEAERARQRQELEVARQQWLEERAQLANQLQDAQQQLQRSHVLPAPSVPAHVASAMALHMWKRARSFVCRASTGLPCRAIDRESGSAVPATSRLEAGAETLVVEELQTPEAAGAGRRVWRCSLLQLRNIWLCADSELACLAWKALRRGTADAECVVLLDGLPGPLGLLVQNSQAREDLLDGLAVLIAVQRSQQEPDLVRRCSPGGLRPPGLSLQSVHISGPICGWLANQGDDLWISPETPAETHLALAQAADDLRMGQLWHGIHG